ncbi:hypothetical protein OAU07_07245 [Alphaproteobacteria bacterium]|jgi:hypothetical protein|nr:hypothetical protein [Alphaproteobacteria bacterium]MDC1157746.1 hypothetical protein [Alphaproteobacteria bacterium]
MKKNNPLTGMPYKKGEFDETKTRRFWSYKTNHVNKDGFFSMSWKNPESFEASLSKQSTRQQGANKQNRKNDYPRRLNPKTGKSFLRGDIREDGYVFCGYTNNGKVKGSFRGESWLSPDSYLKLRISNSLQKARKRALGKGLDFNLTTQVMFELLPNDMRCPILGMTMQFGGDRDNSPSLDRLIPERGYVIGNVKWVSKLANSIKSDRTPEELRKIANWIESQPIWKKHHTPQ